MSQQKAFLLSGRKTLTRRKYYSGMKEGRSALCNHSIHEASDKPRVTYADLITSGMLNRMSSTSLLKKMSTFMYRQLMGFEPIRVSTATIATNFEIMVDSPYMHITRATLEFPLLRNHVPYTQVPSCQWK